MKIELKEDFRIIEEGTEYALPHYQVIDNHGISKTDNELYLKFVRGSKLANENVEKREGTLHEHLLAVMIHDLTFKNNLVPSIEGENVILKLKEALGWLRERQIDRNKRSVVGTYKK